MVAPTLPTYFISRGGGPWPHRLRQMNGAYAHLAAVLREMPRQISATPRAVLAISGHCEEPEFTVTASAHPLVIYDYSGFPARACRVEYAAPGLSQTVAAVRDLLEAAGCAVRGLLTSWMLA